MSSLTGSNLTELREKKMSYPWVGSQLTLKLETERWSDPSFVALTTIVNI